MNKPLQSKAAIVTGAGRGIGRAIALRLAGDGAHVAVAELDLAAAQATVADLTAAGHEALAVQVDVTNRAQCFAMAEQVLARWGRIDILVNNAGVIKVRPWQELTDKDIDPTMAVNVKGVIYCCQAVAPALEKQRGGKIVNLASIAAKTAGTAFIDYNASKAAVTAITRCLAVHFAAFDVNVNSVCPGIVDTQMWQYLDYELGEAKGLPKGEALRQRVARALINRVEKPEDIAGAVAYLCSPDADYITGQSLNVCGGMYLQ
jgi:meso-butanediol dehydrogenase / (S,S)-butanediol dehydrogenase / diacetyl reductase